MKEREPIDDTPVLEAKNLYHVYTSNEEDGNVVALRGLSVSIKSGEAVAVVGPSGSGKSTLLKALGGLMKPSAGSVYLNGKNMTRITGSDLVRLRQETVSFIFKEGNLLPDLNALDNVAQPLRHSGLRGKEARKEPWRCWNLSELKTELIHYLQLCLEEKLRELR